MSPPPADVPDVSPADAYKALQEGPDAHLIDVRTRAEWAYVGLPDLSATDREPLLIEWQTYPAMQVDTDFGATLERAYPQKTDRLYFLCRSGARSLAAAREMQSRGYTHVFNVKDGFEGPPDAGGHRGTVAGWKADGLPWRQN